MGTQKVIAQAILNKKADYILALKGNQSALHYYLGDWRFYQAMRLLSNGPDIPDELILGQEKGHTIFVCGAGVSQPVGLPYSAVGGRCLSKTWRGLESSPRRMR